MVERRSIPDATIVPSIAELKGHLHITTSDQDAMLLVYLKAALGRASAYIGRIIAPTNCVFTGPFSRSIQLPQGLSVSSVALDGETVQSASYTFSAGVLTFGDSVQGDDLYVEFIAGLTFVPDDVKAAVLLIAGDLFLHRENPVKTLPSTAECLLDSHRRWGIDG